MKVVFALRSWANVAYYHSLIVALRARGHAVHLLFDKQWSAADPRDALDTLRIGEPDITWEYMRYRGFSRPLVDAIRELRSYRRYLITSGQSDYYRRRWRRYLPLVLNAVVRVPGIHSLIRSRSVGMLLARFEAWLSPAKRVVEHLRHIQPDVLIVAPVNMRFDRELEYLKAGKSLTIPTVLPVYSWDNLTTKGLIHVLPHRVLAWNAVQQKELRVHHGAPLHGVSIVGAFPFDKWFVSRRASAREEFCRTWGLDAAEPIVLYLGSSRNIAPNEVWLVESLRSALDTNALEGAYILARPHPANVRPYEGFALTRTRVMPPGRGVPATREAVQELYDAFYHADAVVSVNTSAMLDSVCIDTPVISILADTYKETQEDAAHFQALRESGAIVVVSSANECVREIQKICAGVDECKESRSRFIETWIRPRGVKRSAGEWAADEIEELVKNRHYNSHE